MYLYSGKIMSLTCESKYALHICSVLKPRRSSLQSSLPSLQSSLQSSLPSLQSSLQSSLPSLLSVPTLMATTCSVWLHAAQRWRIVCHCTLRSVCKQGQMPGSTKSQQAWR